MNALATRKFMKIGINDPQVNGAEMDLNAVAPAVGCSNGIL
jgi:hypothetical protein